MKKIFSIALLSAVTAASHAQLKVYSGGKVYVGGTSTTPLSTLSIGGAGNSLFQTYSYNPATGSQGANGIRGEIATPTVGGLGVYAVAGVITPGTMSTCVGVLGASYRGTAAAGAYAYGVYGYAGNANNGNNYGVYGYLLGTNNGAGVFGSTSSTTIIPGKYAGYFYGDLRTTDDSPEKPTGGSWSGVSDTRLKKDITDFTDGLAVIKKIRPVNYRYNGIGDLPTEKMNIGIIAQEVQKVAPYCVGKTRIVINASERARFAGNLIGDAIKDSSGTEKYLTEVLNYNQDGLFYAMINAIQELDSTVSALKQQMTGEADALESGKTGAHLNIDLTNNNAVVLYQNQPNPFGESTTIRYFIPESTVGTVSLIFYDAYGQEVNKMAIAQKGFGTLEANTANLADGIYSYSILINDRVVDTKKMIRNK